MELSQEIIDKLDKKLGVAGQPHLILDQNQWIETNCYAWTITSVDSDNNGYEELVHNPELEEAGERLVKIIEEKYSHGESSIPMERVRILFSIIKFVKNEPRNVRKKFVKLIIEAIKLHIFKINSITNSINFNYIEKLDKPLKKIRKTLKNTPHFAYISVLNNEDLSSNIYDYGVVVAPTEDQFEILRIEQTYANNREYDKEKIISELKAIDEKYGITILSVTSESVDFRLKHLPEGEKVREFMEWLEYFCPEFYTAESDFPGEIINIWWD